MAGQGNRIWEPHYTISLEAARALMEIEAARVVVDRTPLGVVLEAELRRRTRLRITHYSTRIEGNRLTMPEIEAVIEQQQAPPAGKERDAAEVRHYWKALLKTEEWAAAGTALTEEMIRRLHGIVERGSRSRPTPYRDGQNVIRDSLSGAIIYLPPEAQDIPQLMAGLVQWIAQAERGKVPIPLIAALAHYQFVTIHPFYDGNGRTARLLATFALHRGGYGLRGCYSLEEYYSGDLPGYYGALAVHPHHNYYMGREKADLTSWIDYFLKSMAAVFVDTRESVLKLASVPSAFPLPEALLRLDSRARLIFGLAARQGRITSSEVASLLGLSDRMARHLLQGWVEDGWLVVSDPAKRSRAYGLSATYRPFIGHSSAMIEEIQEAQPENSAP